MPRPATGAPRWSPRHGCWIARISMPGKPGREPVEMRGIPACVSPPSKPATCECTSCTRARAMAKTISDRMRGGGAVSLGTGETMNEWSKRWLAERETRGLTSVSDDKSRLSNWVLPKLGAIAMAAITRAQIEDLRDELDARVRNDELSWKTATHAWGLVTRAFADACGAKKRDLRVRDDNPAANLEGPDRGVKKAKVYLYPDEFVQLVACEIIPLRWRRLFAFTTYIYARAGEVKALTWADIDFDRAVIHIHESINRLTGETKTTKTAVTRRLPIDPELLPLLLAMREEAGGEKAAGKLVGWSVSDRKLSRQLQRCLIAAKLERADLYANDKSRKPMTFHDLRATGITWCAVRGDDPLKIKQRAGHKTFSTTEGYIREAENLAGNFGAPFPPLPPSLLKAPANRAGIGQLDGKHPKSPRNWWSRRESKPNSEQPKTQSESARAPDKKAGSEIANSAPNSDELARTPAREPERSELSIGVLREKLDRAIDAEEWPAVSIIRERIREAERVAAGNVVVLPTPRRGGR